MQATVGKQTEFNYALKELRGKDVDVSEEAAEIKVCISLRVTCFCSDESIKLKGMIKVCYFLQDYIETLEKLPKARLLDLFQSRYIKSVIVSL